MIKTEKRELVNWWKSNSNWNSKTGTKSENFFWLKFLKRSN